MIQSVFKKVASYSSRVWAFFQIRTVRLIFILALVLGPGALFSNTSSSTSAQQTSLRQIAFPVVITWNRQRGVNAYRLQIARDETFRNVYYDARVIGDRYKVNAVPPGYYYWRVAPGEFRAAEFSKPVRFFVSGGFIVSARPPALPALRPKSLAMPASIIR